MVEKDNIVMREGRMTGPLFIVVIVAACAFGCSEREDANSTAESALERSSGISVQQERDSAVPATVTVTPSKNTMSSIDISEGKLEAIGMTLRSLLAFGLNKRGTRVIIPSKCEAAKYDVEITAPGLDLDAIRETLVKRLLDDLGLEVTKEARPTEVFKLYCSEEYSAGVLTPGKQEGVTVLKPGLLKYPSTSMGGLASGLEYVLGKPVINETKLAGNYSLELAWDKDDPSALIKILAQELRLILRETSIPIEYYCVIVKDPALETSPGKAEVK